MNQMKGGAFNAMDEVRNGSADSGQSSSPDTGSSSSSASIADSLEDNNQQQSRGSKDTKLTHRLDEDDVLAIKNYQDTAALSKSLNNNNNNINDNSSDIVKTTTTTPIIQDASGEAPTKHLSGKENTLNITSENNTKVDSQLENNSPLHHEDSLKQETKQQQQQVNNTATTTNNNYSGLNLNMTASEMRELIARRKKFDPKKAQMNIRQKYEIIQQM